nr:MAG TPA: hypothetical protein [Caudoviricetes sp.]
MNWLRLNRTTKKRTTHVDVVNGQVMPVRGVVEADELVASQPDNEEAHNNGGGAKRRRRKSEE